MHSDLRASIVVPTHNRAHLIRRALESVLRQCVPGDEVIVVDDESVDNTAGVLEEYTSRVRYIRIAHGGAGRARNTGIEQAKNALVGFLDSDDEWMPGKLKLQRMLLARRPDVVLCFSDYRYRLATGEEQPMALSNHYGEPRVWNRLGPPALLSSILPPPEEYGDVPVHIGDLYPLQMEKELVQVNTLLYRRDRAADVRFPEDLRTREDWEFAGRLARKGPAAWLDCETSWLYLHSGPQLTKLDYLMYLEDRYKLLRRVWGSDAEFLKQHCNEYEQIRRLHHWRLIRRWLCSGRGGDARAAGDLSWPFWALSWQPAAVNRIAFRLKDLVRGDH